MKKLLRTATLTMALMGAACGMAWMGNVATSQAYMYGLDNNYVSSSQYPLYLADGVRLCYVQMDSGVYVDETSAYMVSQEGSKYTLCANLIFNNPKNGSQEIKPDTFIYDTSKRVFYGISYNGKPYLIKPITYHSSQGDMRSASRAMQIWHAVMGTDWVW